MTATRDERLVTLVLYLLADTYDVAGRRDIANALVLAAAELEAGDRVSRLYVLGVGRLLDEPDALLIDLDRDLDSSLRPRGRSTAR